MDAATIMERLPDTFGGRLGIRLVEARDDRIRAELVIRDDMRNMAGVVHGGVLMTFADNAGAVGAILNLPAGAGTATIESKTNFFAAARSGTLHAESVPLHLGRTTMVWQTKISDDAGRLVALTTQTQIVKAAKR